MTPENFNLNILTPEGEGDSDEISKLKEEMMSYKPLIDDAIKRQNLKEAEELFAKAKELKEKLNQLRNKEKGTITIEINGQTMELGPELGEMSWDEIPARLEELNKTLKPGEKLWGIPTKEEFEEIEKQVNEIKKDESLSAEQKVAQIKDKLKALGFEYNTHYWSSTSKGRDCAWYAFWGDVSGCFGGDMYNQYSVRCVR
jgi:polyhydroxyalkanoate synthesis regulator phasin